jgi:hypothetical protein
MKIFLTYFVNIIYLVIIILFLIDVFSVSFEIKSQMVKTSIYLGTAVGSPIILIFNVVSIQTISRKALTSAVPVVLCVVIFSQDPMRITFSSSTWKTQTILFQHLNESKTIEYQMQDVGALGYNTRTVQVRYLTPFFTLVKTIPTVFEIKKEWKNVNIEKNECKLKQ